MKLAIIGTGIAGMTAAHLLDAEHEITVFESGDYVGGHTNTVDVEVEGRPYAVDTGFIVHNDWTYPNFLKLIAKLGVAAQPSAMSFSVSCGKTGLEYAGSNLNTLFAQRSNLLRLSFHRMLADIARFNMEAKRYLRAGRDAETMSAFVRSRRFGRQMIESYLLPMMAAIWSSDPLRAEDFPARHFLQFFENHGLLNIANRPQWRVIQGGSRNYMRRLTRPFRDRIRLNSPVERVLRLKRGVEVRARGHEAEMFDEVIIAAHSDQALAMLADPSPAEREILGSIPYQANRVVLHTDERMMPKNRRAWASWNYHIPEGGPDRVSVTYDMNELQSIEAPVRFLVTLNREAEIDPEKVLRRVTYHHPVFSTAAVAAQARRAEISGVNRTHYCGAYWGYGFHEDGVNSALAVTRRFGKDL